MTEATGLFLEQFGGHGSPSITCQCGRRHHAPDSQFIEKAEADEMRADAKDHPKHAFLTNDDGVSAKHIGGASFVPDCPCGALGKLERIIWDERAAILAYFKARRAHESAALAGLDDQS